MLPPLCPRDSTTNQEVTIEVLTNVDSPLERRKISVSEINTMTCLQKHEYAYRRGLSLASTPDYLSKGKYAHRVLAKFLGELPDKRPIEAVTRDVLWEIREDPDLDVTISDTDKKKIDRLLKQAMDDTDPTLLDVVAVEQEFYADIGLRTPDEEVVVLHGYVDAVLRSTETGALWLVEHKTAGRRWAENRFQFDFQSPLYTAAWEALTGERPHGTIWNFFYPARYEPREFLSSPEEIHGKINEVNRMIHAREAGVVMRQPLWGCNGCWYRDICVAELHGMDASATIATKYEVNEDKVRRFESDQE